MKRQPSRAPSPTPTAFSGISNYRTDSYRSIRDLKGAPAVPTIDYRQVSKTHFEELGKYLATYLANAPPNSRSNARSKLTRLTIQQFHELSTDVYDELVRRKNEKEVPFLPVREDFHPKRNQARQKLATLPTTRFEDLSSDVYFELARRYPEFKEDPSGRGSATSNYDDYPAPDFPSSAPPRTNGASRTSGRTSVERPPDSGYGGSVSSRRPSEDRRRPSETDSNIGRRSEDSYRRPEDESLSAALASRRKPSQDTTIRRSEDREREYTPRRSEDREREYVPRRSEDRERDFGRRPSMASDSTTTLTSTAPAQSTTATSAVIIPNKSTMEEEFIDIPYGREARDSGVTTIDERQGLGPALGLGGDPARDGRETEPPDSASEYPSPMSGRSPPAGLGGLSARLKGVEDDDDLGPGNRSGDDLYDKYGRSSVDSTRSAGLGAGGPNGLPSRMMGSRASLTEETEKMRREYEFKIATMQTQISSLQRDLGEAVDKRKESEGRVRQLEEELAGILQQTKEQGATMRMMQKEIEELKEERERELRQAQEDREELEIFRDRCNKLEEEKELRQGSAGGGADADLVEQLRNDMESLLMEINELSRRNDELMTAKDSDNNLIRDLDNQLKEYKRKYEQAKTELRSVKATSQLFLQAPKFDRGEDQLPMAPDGGVQDIHITAFQSSIDSLLTAGRSNAPTRVLTPMKAVVNAVTNIIEDVKAYERRPPSQFPPQVDLDMLRSLRERAEATLSNLVAATKTHAGSSGMSPVSLLDAAASHVSASVTEIGRAVLIRKATKAEQEMAGYGGSGGGGGGALGSSATSGFSPSLRSVEEVRNSSSASSGSAHQRTTSKASTSSRGGRFSESPSSPPNMMRGTAGGGYRRPPSENSSSEQTSSPPPIFDTHGSSNLSGGQVSDDSAQAEGSEDAWAELKPYLEAQTESIVYAIQSVLSGVRSPTPSPSLNENLTQIITIVSSIVAVCNDNLPLASAAEGNRILRELGDHANKLSEVQALPEVTKEGRQIMAKSSFAIANAMKGLMKL